MYRFVHLLFPGSPHPTHTKSEYQIELSAIVEMFYTCAAQYKNC